MVTVNRKINISYVNDGVFFISTPSFHIDLFDKRDIIINSQHHTKYVFFCKKDLISMCKNKYQDENLVTIILKNYPMMKTYIRKLLNDIIEPYICNRTLLDGDAIVITGLDTLDDQVVNILDIVTNHSNDMFHKHNKKLNYEIVLHEQERFVSHDQ